MAANPGWFLWTSSGELAEAVLVARKAMGLTQMGLAKRAGVGHRFVYDLERGKGTLRVDKVTTVLRSLGLIPVIFPAEVEQILRG